MEDIKVGEYVRLARNQGINKIIDEDDDGFLILDEIIADEYGDECLEIPLQDVDKVIIKHSFNLIDLIEPGDYMNGRLVLAVDYIKQNICLLIPLTDTKANTNIMWYGYEDIRTILTHEQFEANCYKVKGE